MAGGRPAAHTAVAEASGIKAAPAPPPPPPPKSGMLEVTEAAEAAETGGDGQPFVRV